MSSKDFSPSNLEVIWSLEAIGTGNVGKFLDFKFLQAYQESSITRTSKGVYVTRFPWKADLSSNLKNPYLSEQAEKVSQTPTCV